MQTYVDPVKFCEHVTDYAREQGWELKLAQLDVPMRYAWTWTWKGVHSIPRKESLLPSRAEALFCACLDLVQQTGWPMRMLPDAPQPMELERPVGLGRAFA